MMPQALQCTEVERLCRHSACKGSSINKGVHTGIVVFVWMARFHKIERSSVNRRRMGVRVHCSASVEQLSSCASAQKGSAEGSCRWTATLANGEEFSADSVVLASGGLSFPAVGTDGTGHRLAELVWIALSTSSCATTGMHVICHCV